MLLLLLLCNMMSAAVVTPNPCAFPLHNKKTKKNAKGGGQHGYLGERDDRPVHCPRVVFAAGGGGAVRVLGPEGGEGARPHQVPQGYAGSNARDAEDVFKFAQNPVECPWKIVWRLFGGNPL